MNRVIRHPGFILIFILVIVVISTLHVSPIFKSIPHKDSGIYLYVAEKFTEGKILYQDTWDHKPPLIYFIDALGLLIKPNSVWGVWLVELFFIFGAGVFGFFLLKESFGHKFAVLGTVFWLLSAQYVFWASNYIENYMLLFKFGILWLFVINQKTPRNINLFLIGVFSALCFLGRQTHLGEIITIIGFYIIVALSSQEWKPLITRLLWIGLGCFTAFLPLGIYLTYHHIWAPFWEQAFVYNFIYVADAVRISVYEIFETGYQELMPIAPIGLIGWMAAVYFIIFQKDRLEESNHLVRLLAGYLPIEILLTSISGRRFIHYYVLWIPAITLSSLFLLYLLYKELPNRPAFSRFKGLQYNQLMVGALTIGLVLIPLIYSIDYTGKTVGYVLKKHEVPYFQDASDINEIILYVQTNRDPDEKVLFWPNDIGYNFLTDRDTPSHWFNQVVFSTQEYATHQMALDFIEDLKTSQAMIIDTKGPGHFFATCNPCEETILDEIRSFITENYLEVARIGPDQWIVYEYWPED